MDVQPFRVQVFPATLEDLQQRLARTRWPDEIPGSDWDYGSNLAYVKELADYWRTKFDWGAREGAWNKNFRWRCTMRTLAFCLCGLACGSLLAGAQQMSQDAISRAPIYRSVAKHERRASAQMAPPPVRAKIDLAQVRREAEELARLAQSIPAGIGQAERGVLPKDLSQNLKKIQKLSKRLRSELSL